MKILFSLFLFACLSFSTCLAQQSLDQSKVNAIESLIKMGAMKFDYDLDKAWISPGVWKQYNVDGKENFTIYSALYIRYKQRDPKSTPMIDLYDYSSGKHLASYGPIRGFRIMD